LFYHFFQEDKDKELKHHRFSKLYKRMDLFTKMYNIQYAHLLKLELMYNLMFHATNILKLHLIKLNKQVLMLDFGKLEMDYKIIFYLCDLF